MSPRASSTRPRRSAVCSRRLCSIWDVRSMAGLPDWCRTTVVISDYTVGWRSFSTACPIFATWANADHPRVSTDGRLSTLVAGG